MAGHQRIRARSSSVILNLAVNARDAMPGGGRLTIATANVRMSDRSKPAELPTGDYVAFPLATLERDDKGSVGESLRTILYNQARW